MQRGVGGALRPRPPPQQLWVGRGGCSGVTLSSLSLSLQPFAYPVCTPEGVVFDLL